MGSRDRELFDLLAEVVASQGVELVEVRLGGDRRGALVRVVIHSPEGVTHGVCADVTQACSRALEDRAALEGAYTIEVSSPGTDRILRDEREFEVFRDRRVRLWIESEGAGSEASGFCAGVRGGEGVVLRTEDGEEVVVPWESVAKARLVPEGPGARARKASNRRQ